MKLNQKVFELASNTGIDLRPFDELLIVINGRVTDVPINKLFSEMRVRSKDIIGYSPLQYFKLSDETSEFPFCLEKDGLNISIKSDKKGDIYFKKVRNPIVQLGDKLINSNFETVIIYLQSILPKIEKKEPIEEENETDELLVNELNDNSDISDLELTNDDNVNEDTKEELIEEEVIEKEDFPYHLKNWEEDSKNLLSEGYEKNEIDSGEKKYVIFTHPEKDDYIVVIISGHHYQLDIKSVKDNVYTFIDMDLKESTIKI